MKSRILLPVTAMAFGLFAVSCSEESSSGSVGPHAESMLLSHAPNHSAGAPSIASLPAYGGLDDAWAEDRGGSLLLAVDASGSIPRFPDSYITSVLVFGYAWVDLDTGRGIVAVIHPAIGRDSRQNPDGWHTHPVQLTGGTTPGGTSDFCVVDIGRSQGGIPIREDVLRVHMSARWAGIRASALDVAAAFVVQGDSGCASGLGVVILDAETL